MTKLIRALTKGVFYRKNTEVTFTLLPFMKRMDAITLPIHRDEQCCRGVSQYPES